MMKKVFLGLLIAANIAMLIVIILNPTGGGKDSASTASTGFPTPAPAASATEAPAAEVTEAPTETPAEPVPAELPYENTLGIPTPSDFAWIADAQSGSLPGSAMGADTLIGKWKAEFVFEGVWELVVITVGRDASISVDPVQINYGDGWSDESFDAPYRFTGSFDTGGVSGFGEYGNMNLYAFYNAGDVQYGVGSFTVQSGETANVYLVRP